MIKLEPFQVFDRAGDIIRSVKDCVYITTKAGEKVNTMAIEWGTLGNLWAKPVFTAYVRDSRFTRECWIAIPNSLSTFLMESTIARSSRYAGERAVVTSTRSRRQI